MGYSKEIFDEAMGHLAKLRRAKKTESEAKKNAFYQRFPRANQIEKELAKTALLVAKTVLSGGDVQGKLKNLKRQNQSLQAEQIALLVSQGLPENFLKVQHICKECEDTGYVGGRLCGCFRQLLRECSFARLNRLSPLALSTFDSIRLDFYPNEVSENGVSPRVKMGKIVSFCKNYAENFSNDSKSLLLQGATGLGKTHISLAIANETISRGFGVIYISAPSLVSQLEKEHFGRNFSQRENTEQYLLDANLLILDDLGAEFQTQFSVATLYHIINSRILHARPTIISTNLAASELQASYSQRFVSRVMGGFVRLYFVGSDVRARR